MLTGSFIANYWDLHQWSIDNLSLFWEEIWEFTGVIYSTPYTRVLDEQKRIEEIPAWFEGARLNFSQNILHCADGIKDDSDMAIIYEDEAGQTTKMTRGELKDLVKRIALRMESIGIGVGDVVAAYAGNVPEAIAFMLASAALGAIFTTCPADFGVSVSVIYSISSFITC